METRNEFLARMAKDNGIIFHWLACVPDEEDRNRLKEEVDRSEMFVFAPAMFVYFKDEETGTWMRGAFWFNPDGSSNIIPITSDHMGEDVDTILQNLEDRTKGVALETISKQAEENEEILG
jgi:hypothetical protein